MTQRFAAVLAAVALAVTTAAAAGCGGGGGSGGSEAGGYVATVNAAQSDFRRRLDALATTTAPTSTPDDERRTLARFRVAVDDVLRRLHAVRPPASVEALHQRLIAGILAYGSAIDRAGRAFDSRDARQVLAAQGELRGAVAGAGAQVNRTIDEINARLRAGG